MEEKARYRFLRNIEFTEEEKVILAALRDFNTLDFATIQGVVDGEIAVVGKALAWLMDLHVIEEACGGRHLSGGAAASNCHRQGQQA